MPDLVQLTCTACGAKLKITHEIDRYACSTCGTEFVVQRGEGIVALQPLVQGLSDILVANKRISNELSVSWLRQDIDALEREIGLINEDTNLRSATWACAMAKAGKSSV